MSSENFIIGDWSGSAQLTRLSQFFSIHASKR